jgi:hypothetical protein
VFAQDGRSYRGLAVTEAAVTRAHGSVLEDFKPFRLQTDVKQTCEAAVVHASAGQGYLFDAGGGSRLHGCANEG